MSQDRRTQPRTYSGEEECQLLVDWLNQNGKTPAGLRIQALLTFAHLLSQAGPDAMGDGETRDLKEAVSYLHRAWVSIPYGPGVERAEALRRVAKRVEVPKIRGRLSVKFQGAGATRRLALVLASDTVEGEAVLTVLRLSQGRVVDRVKKCPCCGKWFFSRFLHQQFCEFKCQQKSYRAGEEWKGRRREWARQNYALKKRGVGVK